MRRRHLATAVVGPSTLLREGLARILGAANFRVIASAPSVRGLVLPSSQKADSVLFVIDGDDDPHRTADEIRRVKEQYPSGRVAVLIRHHPPRDLTPAFQAGANVCVGDFASCDALLKALELVMLDESILPFTVFPLRAHDQPGHERERTLDDLDHGANASADPESNHAARLSAREKCIVRCLLAGDSNKVIARKIDIAEATVKVHIKAILRKIRVQNRTQAAIWAMNHGSLLLAMNETPKHLPVLTAQIASSAGRAGTR
jgi:two-component system, NarL family, nitrate/nitrite response regulator NarL